MQVQATFSEMEKSLASLDLHHDVWQPLRFYMLVAFETLGPVLIALMLIAIVVFLVRWAFKPEVFAAPVILAPTVLYAAAMYSSLVMLALPLPFPLDTQDLLFKARLGAELVVPAAIFIATLMGGWRWRLNVVTVF